MEPEATEPSMDDFMGAQFDALEAAEPADNPVVETEPEIGASEAEASDVEADEIPDADEASEGDTETEASEPETAIAAPQSMSAKDRESFNALPPESQKWLTERVKQQEADYTRKTMEVAERSKSFDKLEQIIAPRRAQLAMDGMDDGAAVGQLFALSDFANRDPVAFTRYLFEQRGIPLSAINESDGQQAVDPQLAAMQNRLHGLENYLSNQQAQSQAQQNGVISTVIEDFAKANPFYADLENDMVPLVAALRQSQPGLSNQDYLDKAYKMAAATNPDVSSKMASDANAKTEADRIAKAKKDGDKAKRAASTNIRSSGTLPPGAAKAKSVDDFVGALFDERMTA